MIQMKPRAVAWQDRFLLQRDQIFERTLFAPPARGVVSNHEHP